MEDYHELPVDCGVSCRRRLTLFKCGEPKRISDAYERAGISNQANRRPSPERIVALRCLPMPPPPLVTVLLVLAMAAMPTVLGLVPALVAVDVSRVFDSAKMA